MDINRVIIILAVILSVVQAIDMQIGGKKAHFDRFDGMCQNDPGVLIQYNYTGLRTEGTKLYLNSTIIVKEDIIVPPTLSILIQRCTSKESLDSCEDYYNYHTKHYCQYIKSPACQSFQGKVRPEWKCPIKKGIYKAVDGSFDATAFVFLPISDRYFWRARSEMYDGQTSKRIMCIVAQAYVTRH